ncbi:predicted protein [Naegleria gruberi]|uniref:Predicted protein n=1 Tax=Naegleria gruberi TaxID=5762 RepID=D2VA48_NAEGR|nr:uncharacterized protein NAEGRDRAFT_65737 [Naegleria gruberi]EFC46246.1 predicted protein [Naegleria gruberi]|eukprot:XP_002678990.1 predicted protein [Naegleria gruberi strain NEG-M]
MPPSSNNNKSKPSSSERQEEEEDNHNNNMFWQETKEQTVTSSETFSTVQDGIKKQSKTKKKKTNKNSFSHALITQQDLDLLATGFNIQTTTTTDTSSSSSTIPSLPPPSEANMIEQMVEPPIDNIQTLPSIPEEVSIDSDVEMDLFENQQASEEIQEDIIIGLLSFENPNIDILNTNSGKIPNLTLGDGNLFNYLGHFTNYGIEPEFHSQTHEVMNDLTDVEELPALPYALSCYDEETCLEKPIEENKESANLIDVICVPKSILDLVAEIIIKTSSPAFTLPIESEIIREKEDSDDEDEDDSHPSRSFSLFNPYYKDHDDYDYFRQN